MRQNTRNRTTSSEKMVKDIRRAISKQYSAEKKIGTNDKRTNNRAENSHQAVRCRKRKMQRFKPSGSTQRSLNLQSAAYNIFYLQRHLLNRKDFKQFRAEAFNVWRSASTEF